MTKQLLPWIFLFLTCMTTGCAHIAEQHALAQKKREQSTKFPPAIAEWHEARFSRNMYGALNPNFMMLDCNEVLDLRGQICPIGEILTPTIKQGLDNVFAPIQEQTSAWAYPTELLDQTLEKSGLVKYFPKAKGYVTPAVRVIAAEPDKIDFWFFPGHASLEQTQAAATDWCSRSNRIAVFEGGALGCTPLASNDQEYKEVRSNNPNAQSNQQLAMLQQGPNGQIGMRVNNTTITQTIIAVKKVRDTRVVAAYGCR